jgi:hypothetical protein
MDILRIDGSPSKSNTTAVAHAVAEDLAGNDMIAGKDGVELLANVSHQVNAEQY